MIMMLIVTMIKNDDDDGDGMVCVATTAFSEYL